MKRSVRAFLLPAATAGVVGISSAYAGDLQFNPRVQLSAGYDDNPTLAAGNQNAAPGTFNTRQPSAEGMADAKFEFRDLGPSSDMRITPEVKGVYYPDHSNLDSNGEFLYLVGTANGPRYQAGVFGYVSSQLLFKDYLPTAALGTGLGTTEPGATIGNLTNIRQTSEELSPGWSIQYTPRVKLSVDVNYLNSSYNHQFNGGYVDFRDVGGDGGVMFNVIPNGSILFQVLGSDFRPHDGLETNSVGFRAEWDGKYSATKEYYARIGVDRSSFTAVGAGLPNTTTTTVNGVTTTTVTPAPTHIPSATSISAGLGTHWTFQVTEVFVDLTRNVSPTGIGYSVVESSLRLRYAWRVTPKFATFVGARAIDDQAFAGVGANLPTQKYAFATAGFEWRWLRSWSVIGTYDFAYRDYVQANIGALAHSNTVMLSLVYEPHRPVDSAAITVGY
jgi:hypothetical protein